MTEQKQCNPDCKLLPMSDRYCTDCVVFQNWEQDQKQKLYRLWAEKIAEKFGYENNFIYIDDKYEDLYFDYRYTSLSEIKALMETDGVGKEEIEKVINK